MGIVKDERVWEKSMKGLFLRRGQFKFHFKGYRKSLKDFIKEYSVVQL